MRGDEQTTRVTPSLLDRLIDLEPGAPDTMLTRTRSPREIAQLVRRDLEHLLNTRNTFADLPRDFDEVRQSVLSYGIPDLTGIALGRKDTEANAAGASRIRGLLETAIRTFEPRLSSVSISLTRTPDNDRSVVLHVNARLQMEPSPEAVAFDVMVSLNTRECRVTGLD